MTKRDDTAPATKSDIKDIHKKMATKDDIKDIHKKMATKDDIKDIHKKMATSEDLSKMEERLTAQFATKGEMRKWKDEIKEEFRAQIHILSGDIRKDLVMVRADEIEVMKDVDRNHETRILRLEKRAGYIPV